MDIKSLLLLDDKKEIVKELKSQAPNHLPKIEDVEKYLDPKKHKIFDKAFRPDKLIREDDGATRNEKVARIAIAMQKLIIKKAVSFLFGNSVTITAETADDKEKAILETIKNILTKNKINSFNRKIARTLFSCGQVAELWYPVPIEKKQTNEHGINFNFKLKVKELNPLKGDKLFPYFDEYGDLVAFSREYIAKENGTKKKYLETYTSDSIYRFDITDKAVLVDGFPKENPIKKIPIIYGLKDQTEFEDVQDLIERLELLLSNFADTNDYHASPKIFVKGKVVGFSKKGESGTIIEGSSETDAKYLSWQHAPESVKLEIETLLNMIYTLTQTPDISFNNLKNVGNIAEKSIRLMFLDAHLKVADQMEIFEEYLERRISIIKSFIATSNLSLEETIKNIEIDSTVVPYMLDDKSEQLDFIMTATGNKQILSTKTAVEKLGLVDDTEREFNQIQKENSVDVFEPTEE